MLQLPGAGKGGKFVQKEPGSQEQDSLGQVIYTCNVDDNIT